MLLQDSDPNILRSYESALTNLQSWRICVDSFSLMLLMELQQLLPTTQILHSNYLQFVEREQESLQYLNRRPF